MKITTAVFAVLALATPVAAQNFDVVLGGKTLGWMAIDTRGAGQLRTTLDNTPLGVFNGTFEGTRRTSGAGTTTFTGISRSSRKSRAVSVNFSEGRATGVDVEPASERTALSDIAQVPAAVTDPITALGALVHANGCPPTQRIYEGRRVIALIPEPAERNGVLLVCPVSYRVIAGPGHLSPLRISSARMRLTYAVSGSRQTLQQIHLSSGIFSVSINRSNGS
ncbi:hypothetical protein [uncultured Sulfitobacter sp.]|uniref:hypothetical protein n=1 Tax=uncultured Sulfitobacter sp. TaxID=191468 RepID=UPI00260CDEAE|nr:hypothetical protein [uncultured Sulfitobacter sp.]